MLQLCFSRVISWLSNPRKTCVFSFIGLMWQIFKTLSISLSLPHSLNPNLIFSLNPIIFKLDLCTINLQSFHFSLRICRNWVRVLELGFFEKKGLGMLILGKIFKILIGLSPIWSDCIYVGPLWHFKHVFRHISVCSCIAHRCITVLHAMCLTKCSSDIFVVFWTQLSSIVWVYPWFNLLDMFWSLGVRFTHFA